MATSGSEKIFSLTEAGIKSADIKVIVTMIFVILLFGSFISFMLSVVNSLGLYEMTKTLGIKSKWFAFFPFFRSVAFGKLADCAKGTATSFFRKILLILNVMYFSLLIIGLVGFHLGFVDTVFKADEILLKNGTVNVSVLSPLLVPVIIIGISLVIYLIYRVFYYICICRIFSAFAPKKAVVYTVFSVLFPFIAPLFLFFIRKNKPVFPRREGYNYFSEGQNNG